MDSSRVTWISLILLVGAPLVLTSYFMLALWDGDSFRRTADLLEEGEIVETITFIVFLLATLFGIFFLIYFRGSAVTRHVWWFYAIFVFGMFFCMMEEIAWGQKLFDFDIPESLRRANAQGDLTFHNIHALQGHSEYFRVIFSLGGLVGLLIHLIPKFRSVSVPPPLTVVFILIAILSLLDLYLDYVDMGRRMYLVFGKEMSEIVELLIAYSGLSYLLLKWRSVSIE